MSAEKRIILTVSRMTLHNGPGIRTLILFKGCPLRCQWCSTPESQNQDPEIALYPEKCTGCGRCLPACDLNAIRLEHDTIVIDRSLCSCCGKCAQVCHAEAVMRLGKEMTVEQLVTEVKKDAIFYKHSGGGVTLSGGEPLLYPGFTGKLLNALKEEAVNTGVDTCGHVPWENIEPLLPNIDFFLWDIKHTDPEKHHRLTGADNRLILSNLSRVCEQKIPVYIRVPVIPGCNDSIENIRNLCELVRSFTSVREINLLPMHHLGTARYESLNREYPLARVPLPSDAMLYELRALVESYNLKCNIGG